MKARPIPALARRALPRGFTLVEMLVSLVLLSLLMVGMISVVHSMGQAQDRVDARMDASDALRVSIAFTENALGHISTRRSARGLQMGQSPFQFSARPQELIWVGVMPARFGMGGRYYFRLALENSAVVLRFAPWDGAQGFPDWNGAQSYEVARAVTSFSMSYEDSWQPVPQWVDTWQRVDSVPARVRIDLSTQTGAWPMWIVPMRPLPANEPGNSRFASGPGGGVQ